MCGTGGKAVGGSVGNMFVSSVTPLPLELVGDGRHESAPIGCNRDGGIVQAGAKIQT